MTAYEEWTIINPVLQMRRPQGREGMSSAQGLAAEMGIEPQCLSPRAQVHGHFPTCLILPRMTVTIPQLWQLRPRMDGGAGICDLELPWG